MTKFVSTLCLVLPRSAISLGSSTLAAEQKSVPRLGHDPWSMTTPKPVAQLNLS
jgi:hypothetical protein